MTTFNWLHLTDLHYGQKEQIHLWSQAREMFFDDLKKMHDRCGPFDAVFFTGDLVFSGEKKQFEGFENEVLNRLYETLRSLQETAPVLLAVPGNHDLKRYPKQISTVRVITSADFESNPDGFWDDQKNEYRNAVEKALKNYRDWWEKTPYRRSQPIRPGIFTGDFATTLQVGEFKVGVVGLNSTNRQLTAGDFEDKLLLHSKQLHHACGGDIADWLNRHHVCLLLTHQGPKCLTKNCRTEEYEPSIYGSGRFAVHLFGHMHEHDYVATAQAGAESRRYYQGASWFGMEHYGEPPKLERKHGYAMGRLEFSNGQINLRFWPREGTVGGDNTYSFKRDSQAKLREEDGGTEPTLVGSYQQKPAHDLPIEISNEVVPPASSPFPLENIKITNESIINPYKNLGFYDVVDEERFVGRDDQTREVITALIEGFDKFAKLPIVRISGPSGTGKSSLLRAGVIAKLKQERAEDQYIVFRPTDFHDSNGVPADIIKKLLLFIDSQTELRINSSTMEHVVASPRSVGKAVELIENLLKQKSPENFGHLIIGLDQFEEVIDDLSNPQFAKYWGDLKEFIDQAGKSKQIGLLLTLESSRERNFKCCGLSEKIIKCANVRLDGFTEEFLKIIVRTPFREAGYPLSDEVVGKLLENANQLKTTRGYTNEHSLLPLLALKLYHLFDKVVAIKGSPVELENNGIQKSFGGTGDDGITLKELNSEDENLEISGEIENLANAAWFRATGKEEVNSGSLGHFLKPLVRLANPNSDNLVLGTIGISPYEMELRLAKEFRESRLLAPVDNDRDKPRLRLVHEAVIRYWPPAATWLNEQADFLKMEAVVRLNCDKWFANGRPDPIRFSSNKRKKAEIDNAAEILSTYLRTWSVGNREGLEKADEQLLDYCLNVFNLSDTPRKLVPNSPRDSLYVHLAASYGQTELLKKFKLIDSACLDVPRKDGRTPIDSAAWAHLEAVRFLLENHCNATHADNDGWSPIAAAIQMDRRDIFDLLLPRYDKDSFFLSKTKGYTLLHFCAQCGRLEMAREFADKEKITPDSVTKNGWLPLHNAALNGHLAVFDYLAKRSDVTAADKNGWTVLHLAAQGGHYPIVNSLLKNPAFRGHEEDQTELGFTALMIAASNHRVSVLPLLLEVSDPNLTNSSGSSALHLAIRSYSALTEQRCLETVQLLLADQRTDPNQKNAEGITPLGLAKDKPNLLKILLQDSRIDPDLPCSEKQDDTPLLLAVKAKNWAVFEQLLQRSKRDCSLPIDDKKNALLHALAKSNAPFQIIEALLNAPNLDINALNQKGYTPLMTAIAENAWDLTRSMLASDKIDRAIFGDEALPPLALAMMAQAESDILELLWYNNCDELAAGDKFGLTPLHIAALRNDITQIEWMESHCQNLEKLAEQKDKRGRTPRDIASSLAYNHLASKLGLDNAKTQPAPKSWDSDLQWLELSSEKRKEFVDLIAKNDQLVDGKYKLTKNTSIKRAELTFYDPDSVRIVRLTDPAWNQKLQLFYLETPDLKLIRLNGTSPPIHEVNASHIRLDKDNALDYLRFFCFFIRAKDGPFTIVESLSQQEVPDNLTVEERSKIKSLVSPARLENVEPEKTDFFASAYVWYSNAIFFADFLIQSSGMIDMENDEPLLANLSKTVNMPIA